ncbi:MAG: F0F1 ATP synthase subunit gamma [Clostridiales bacterium]|jgi:F0F1-type ATP synthase gamma subunit|nr:F0F1 ATP synthase subunit gamma [Clostridiales bacterium]
MDSTQQIKSRICNISSTRQITQSMRLVASAKVKRAQARLAENRQFLGEAAQMVLACAASPEAAGHPYVSPPAGSARRGEAAGGASGGSAPGTGAPGTGTGAGAPGAAAGGNAPGAGGADAAGGQHSAAASGAASATAAPGTARRAAAPPPAVLVACGDRGLCGGYNANLCRLAYGFVRELGDARVYTVGAKAREFFRRRRPAALQHSYTGISENPFFEDAEGIAALLLEEYRRGAVGAVYIVYTKFVHMLMQVPKVARLLPLDPGALAEFGAGAKAGSDGAGADAGSDALSAGMAAGSGIGAGSDPAIGAAAGSADASGANGSAAGVGAGSAAGTGAAAGAGTGAGGSAPAPRQSDPSPSDAGTADASPPAPRAGAGGKLRRLTRFEPSEPGLLDSAMPFYLSAAIFGAMLESSVCEQGARITGMDSAVRNSEDMIESLTITYNQARQGAITDELTEILSGARAVRKARQKT